jgi:hypothetical protein
MKTILSNLRPYGYGVRPLGEVDLHRICDQERIRIVWSDDEFAFSISEVDWWAIVIPKRLKGLPLLFAAFHEIAHLLGGHAGETPCVMWNGFFDDKNEAEADAMALIALIPLSHLNRQEFLDGSRIAKKLWNERLRLYFLYGI